MRVPFVALPMLAGCSLLYSGGGSGDMDGGPGADDAAGDVDGHGPLFSPVVAYCFDEIVVREGRYGVLECSDSAVDLDLRFDVGDEQEVELRTENGSTFMVFDRDRGTHLETRLYPAGLVEACSAAGSASIAVWVTPGGAAGGTSIPARIFTAEEGTVGDTLFMIGQTEDDLVVRALGYHNHSVGEAPFALNGEPELIVAVLQPPNLRVWHDGVVVVDEDRGLFDLSQWDEVANVRLAAGNAPQGSGNRPFDGAIHAAAVYCPALSAGELDALLEAGP